MVIKKQEIDEYNKKNTILKVDNLEGMPQMVI